jgi:hypothetical protein
MPLVSSLESSNLTVGLFVGPSGAGKTCAIASYAALGPMYIFDFDGRMAGMLGQRSVLGEHFKNIEYDRYDISKGFLEVDKRLDVLVAQAQNNSLKYKTIVFESLPTMINSFMEMAVQLEGVKSAGIPSRLVGGVHMLSPQHYNWASRAFRDLVYNGLRRLVGCNVIVSGWTVDQWGKRIIKKSDGSESVDEYGPKEVIGRKLLLTEKIAEEVPGYFDEVYEFDKQDAGLPSQPTKFVCKFRSSIAKTAHENYPNWIDFTSKSFHAELNKLTSKEK